MRWWFGKNREEELQRELHSHLELESAEQRDEGKTEEEARYAAMRALGNKTMVAEDVRDVWGFTALHRSLYDLRFALRRLRKSPGFTTATILTLALGIGANSAIFSIIDGVLLKPLPFEQSDQLVEVYSSDAQGHTQYVSQPDLDDWRTMSHSFTELASWVPQSVNLTGLEQPERVTGMFVSSNFFSMLGVSPALGRSFAKGEDRIGGERVAIISGNLWQARFASNPAILGKSAEFNGEPYTIIGVLPKTFVLPTVDADVYLPAFKYPNYTMDRALSSCAVMARLRPGVSMEAALTEMKAVTSRLEASYPASNKSRSAKINSFREGLVSGLRPSMVAMSGAVAFLLLIVCANVASLLIARMVAQQRETSVRIAIGASRAQLISHVLAEAVLLAAFGGGLGLLLAWWSVPAIANGLVPYLPYGTRIELDTQVLLFTLSISVASALLVAFIPAWQNANVGSLRAGRSGTGKHRARTILVTTEIALALVLLVGAGLMIRSFAELGRTEAGFDTHNLLTLAYRVPRNKYPSGTQQNQFHGSVVEKIKAVPGVISASSVRAVPMGGNGNMQDFLLMDRPEPPAAERPKALLNFADPFFFSTMRVPLLRGRVFEERDQEGSPLVAVINETLNKRFFAGRDPIGQHLKIPAIKKPVEIIGVVGDVKQFTLTDPATPQIYGALGQNPFIFTSLAVRTAGDPMPLVNSIRNAIWQVDKDQPVWGVRSFDELLVSQASLRKLITMMLGAFAAVAMLLASIGIFGVISYTVTQRTAEIGLRVALGARPSDVARLILRLSFYITLCGIAIGTCAAMWLSRFLQTQLYEVSPLDPSVYASVAALLAIVAIVACLLPVRRAARLDPTVAMRYE